MSIQHTHESTPFAKKVHPLTLLCDQVSSPANIGGIFRLADAFGVEQLFFSSEIDPSSTRLRKTARGTENEVPYQCGRNLIQVLQDLKKKEYQLVGLEITSESNTIQNFINKQEVANSGNIPKIALVVGSEKHGISKDVLDRLDTAIHITMYGKNSSMNVTQATAIALFALTQLFTNHKE